MTAEELAGLAEKYARLIALAEERDAAHAVGGFGETAGEVRKQAFRALARDFPGALRELEALSTTALRARGAAVSEAQAGGAIAPWIPVVVALHAGLRELLAARRAGARTGPLLDVVAARLGLTRQALVGIAFGAVSSGCG
jgi:hypothetical protein